MNLRTLLIFSLFSIINDLHGQDWVTTKINDFASITFPIKPEKVEMQGVTILKVSDSTGLYSISFQNWKKYNASELKGDKLLNAYKDFAKGMVETVKGKILEQNEFEFNGIKGLKTLYVSEKNLLVRTNRLLLYNECMFIIDFWTSKELIEETKQFKDKFFNSLVFSSTKVDYFANGKRKISIGD